jgi:DNA mismatch repair protein MSH5
LARTPQGKLLLRQYFLRPSLNLAVINERLDTIDVFLKPDNVTKLEEIIKNLVNIKNIRPVMINLRKGVGASTTKGSITKSVWSTLIAFVFHALKIRDTILEVNEASSLNICIKILKRFESSHLAAIGRQIVNVVDFSESQIQRRTVVRSGVDRELDQLRHDYDGLESMLSVVCREIAKRVPMTFQPVLNVIYFPQIGFLISVQRDPGVEGVSFLDFNGERWERIFITDQIEYYKNSEMREMDEKFGDLWTSICDMEIEIIHSLAQDVLHHEPLLTTVSDICGELDSLLALTQGALQYKLTRPRMTTDNIIQIKAGRHILQELTVPCFVANDTNIASSNDKRKSEDGIEDVEENLSNRSHPMSSYASKANNSSLQFDVSNAPSLLILTGPNYSGKSVYLKQVALIVYMAHIGSFIPAELANIGVTDKILTRVSTRESVSRIQSAFMIDLQQVGLALSLCTRRSFLVIDEFGKGTEGDDGAGLMCGVLEYLNGLGEESPKIIAATHFHGKSCR